MTLRLFSTACAAVVLISALGLPAVAQTLPAAPDGTPVEVTADNAIEWHQAERAYVARGHAVGKRGDSAVEADVLTAYYKEVPGKGNQIYQLVGDGNVRILGPGRQVFGNRAIYDAERRIVVVSGGDLKMVTETDTVTARESLEFYEGENHAVARGDAVAVRGGDRLRADVLIGQFAKGPDGTTQMTRIDGSGKVVVTTATDVATGEKLVYSVPEQIAVLIGDVKITRGENQLDGEAAEMNMKTKVNRVIAGKEPGGRVKALLIPGSDGSGVPGAPAKPGTR